MKHPPLESRVRALEIQSTAVVRKHQPSRRSGQANSTSDLLEELRTEVWKIKERAEAAGEERLALHCIRLLFESIEFEAKLRGKFDDRPQTNVVNVNFDPAIAVRIARTYLARHGAGEQERK